MNISMVSFTKQGTTLAKRIYSLLQAKEYHVEAFAMKKFCDEDCLQPLENKLEDWTSEQFSNKDAIVFIGACGIAVRGIAPCLKNKTKDPAVIVIDELGKYIIPILSGHIGGANQLANAIAQSIGGLPVITTATDINNKFAVDVFAKQNNLFISNMKYAKMISAELLEGKDIGFTCEGKILGKVPEYLKRNESSLEVGIAIAYQTNCNPNEKTLHLIPKVLSLGIGCRKGKSVQEIEEIFQEVLKDNAIAIQAIENVASIDLKKSEEGILKLCQQYNLPITFYSNEELSKVEGEFTKSEFVQNITGVENVCERAAVKASNNGRLKIKKYAKNGVTIAIAEKEWCVNFE